MQDLWWDYGPVWRSGDWKYISLWIRALRPLTEDVISVIVRLLLSAVRHRLLALSIAQQCLNHRIYAPYDDSYRFRCLYPQPLSIAVSTHPTLSDFLNYLKSPLMEWTVIVWDSHDNYAKLSINKNDVTIDVVLFVDANACMAKEPNRTLTLIETCETMLVCIYHTLQLRSGDEWVLQRRCCSVMQL